MKKAAACLMSIIIILTGGSYSASAANVNDNGRVIFSSGFEYENSILQSSVVYIDSKGESVLRNTDGFMRIEKSELKTDPYFDVNLASEEAGSLIFSTDIRKTGKATMDLFKLRYSDSSMVTLVTYGSDGIIRNGDTGLFTPDEGENANVAVLYKQSGYFEVYVNGEMKKSGNTGKNLKVQFVRCQIFPDENAGTVDIDNFKIFPAESYGENPESYILNKDFNDEKTFKEGFVRITGSYISYKEEACLEITTQDKTKDPYIDITIPDSDTFSSLVFSADFKMVKSGAKTTIFQARNSDKEYLTDIFISDKGFVYQKSNKLISLSEDEYTNIAVIYDVKNASYDVYINEEKKITGAKSLYGGNVEKVRFQVMPGVGTGSLKIDNLSVYEGTALKKTEDTDSIIGWSVLPSDKADILRLENAVAYHTHRSTAFYNGEKHEITGRPFIKNSELFIPGEIAFPITGEEISGAVPLKKLCDDYNKELFYDETGLIIITDGEFLYKNNLEAVKRLSTYLFSERPDRAQIEALYNNSPSNGVHPRLLMTKEDFDYLISQREQNSYISDWIEDVIYKADDILHSSPCEYRLQEFRLNAVVSVVLERILTTSFAYRVTGDEVYASRALEEMKKVITYPDWNPQHFLDTAEMTFAMAIGYDWCYDFILKNGLNDKMADAIINMGLMEGDKQYRGRATGTSFIYRDMNWNPVCNAGMCIGALAVIEKAPELSYNTVKNAVRSLEYILPAFAPDGGWQEGTGYFEYALGYLIRMTESLKTSLGTDFGIPHFKGIENSVMYAISMQGSKGSNNYHDSSETTSVIPEILWAGKYFERTDYSAYYLKKVYGKPQDDSLWRCLYYDRETTRNAQFSFPEDMLFKNLEAASMRESYMDKNGTYLSFHGGKNDVNHRQFDAGTFVLDMIGERWASDLGTEPLSYLGVASEKLYRVRAEGHNTLVIDPSVKAGQEEDASCPVTDFVTKKKGAFAKIDLTSAYKNRAESAVRGFMLTDDRRTAVIRDEIVLKEESTVYWFMHTAADILIEDESTAILTIGKKSVQLKMKAEGASATLGYMAAEPLDEAASASGQADNSAYKKVLIKLTGSGALSLSVRITPLEEKYAMTEFMPEKLSEWNIEDGEITEDSVNYGKEYIIHSELFDKEINSPTDIYTLWQLKNGSGTISGMIQSTKNSIVRMEGIGEKAADDGCVAVKTEGLSSQTGLDPFVQIECSELQKGTVTFEFEVYSEGRQTVYIQLVGDNAKTSRIMELKPDGFAYFSNEKVICAQKKWHRIALTFHCRKKTADIYFDGRLIAKNVSSLADVKRIKIISLYPMPGEGEALSGITAVDNVRVYPDEKESYYYKLFRGGEETKDYEAADEIYINASKEAGKKIYLAEYSDENEVKSVNIINPGEDLRKKFEGKSKILIWDKYSISPQENFIALGGNKNE